MNSVSTIIDHVQNLGIISAVNIQWPPETEKVIEAVINFLVKIVTSHQIRFSAI